MTSAWTGGLGAAYPGHDCVSVQEKGWSGIKNGDLVVMAEQNQFDLVLTGDRNLAFQQNTTQFHVAVVVLEAEGVQLRHTLPLMPKVLMLLPSLQPGQIVRIGR